MFYILPTLQVGQPLHNYCGGKRLYHLKYGLFRDTGALGQVRTCDSPLNTAVSTQILLEKTTMQVIKRKQTRSVWGCEPPLPSGLSKVLRRLAMTRMITLPWVTTSPPIDGKRSWVQTSFNSCWVFQEESPSVHRLLCLSCMTGLRLARPLLKEN